MCCFVFFLIHWDNQTIYDKQKHIDFNVINTNYFIYEDHPTSSFTIEIIPLLDNKDLKIKKNKMKIGY